MQMIYITDFCYNAIMKMYIARHGQTQWNVERRIQGHGDSPLTDLGKQQAQELGKILSGVRFDAVFSSDLLRAKRTAEQIILERKLEVITTKLLRERAFGTYEGQYIANLKEFDEILESLSDKERFSYKTEEGIENDEEIVGRFLTLTREIAVRFTDKTVLMVTHAGLMYAFLIHTGFATYSQLPHGSIKNTAYIEVDTDGVDFAIKDTYGISYLP